MYNIENVVLFDKKQTNQFMCLFADGISKMRNNYEKIRVLFFVIFRIIYIPIKVIIELVRDYYFFCVITSM